MSNRGTQKPMTVEEVADEVISRLDSKEIDSIRHHPSSTDMHFGLGLWIRNEYIHSGKMGSALIADDISSEITKTIAAKLLPEYADFPLAVALFDWPRSVYASAHRYYLDHDLSKMVAAVRAHYEPLADAEAKFGSISKSIDWSSEGHEQVWNVAWKERSDARDTFADLVINDLSGNALIDKIRSSLDEKASSRLDGLIRLRDYSLEDENAHSFFFVPAEIAFLSDPNLKGSENWEKGKDALLWLIDEISFYPEEMPLPSWLFDDDEIALAALRINGNFIQFMGDRCSNTQWAIEALRSAWPSYKFIDESLLKDREVVKAAFSCDRCGNVLFEDSFRNYNDDDELVALALGSSGENLSWTSERIRDDFDMVCLAIENSSYIDNIYNDISGRLRADRRIVEKIASRSSVPMEFPPDEYKDDDEIGALLADIEIHGNHSSLLGMCRRIKEMYMTEDELDHWGSVDDGEEV